MEREWRVISGSPQIHRIFESEGHDYIYGYNVVKYDYFTVNVQYFQAWLNNGASKRMNIGTHKTLVEAKHAVEVMLGIAE